VAEAAGSQISPLVSSSLTDIWDRSSLQACIWEPGLWCRRTTIFRSLRSPRNTRTLLSFPILDLHSCFMKRFQYCKMRGISCRLPPLSEPFTVTFFSLILRRFWVRNLYTIYVQYRHLIMFECGCPSKPAMAANIWPRRRADTDGIDQERVMGSRVSVSSGGSL
jgi:hypothetical protein